MSKNAKYVEIQKIRLQNFLSYGETPVEVLFSNGVTFVTGYNKDDDDQNGVGKTSLLVDSLSFLLFGETYKKINQSFVKNKRTSGSCIVEGWFKINDDQYHIVRSLAPKQLILEINGESAKHTKSIPETNKDIIAALGVSENMFINTIIMTNKDSLAFLNQKKASRIEFIEGILGLEAFSSFYEKSKDEFKAVTKEKDKINYNIDDLEKSLRNNIMYFEQEISRNKQDIANIQTKISEIENSSIKDNTEYINELNLEIAALEETNKKFEEKISAANNKKFQLNFELQQKTKDLSSIQFECKLCKRPFTEHDKGDLDKHKSQLELEIKSIQKNVVLLSNALNKVETNLSTNKNLLNKHKRDVGESQMLQRDFLIEKSKLDNLKSRLDELNSWVNPFDNIIKKTETELESQKIAFNVLCNKYKVANYVKELASPTGVKALMIKKIIQTLNDRINFYLSRLGSPFIVTFDEYFDETVKHKDGSEFTYASLSGGEAKRVDFAMLFSFRDIRRLQSNVSVNLTVMDELFDSALSEKGMFNVIELLKEIDNECFMIVTHRSENVDEIGCKSIHLIKENGITRINDNE